METDNFPHKHQLPKLNQDQVSKLNKPINAKKIETIIKVPQPKKAQGQMVPTQNSTRFLKNN